MTAPQPRPPPLLASDALREDLAPLEPLHDTTRPVCLLSAASLAVVCTAQALFIPSPHATRSAIEGLPAALITLFLGLVPPPYAARAHALTALGAALLLAALLGHGPAAGLLLARGTALPWETSRILAAVLLPAALVFRAHYRAFPLARILLGWGVALALPFVLRSVYLILFAPEWGERFAAAVTIGSVLLTMIGFMGSETNAMGSLWAGCLLGALALDVAARALIQGELRNLAAHGLTALAFLVGAALAAFGLFQTLAAVFAPAARRAIDQHRARSGLAARW